MKIRWARAAAGSLALAAALAAAGGCSSGPPPAAGCGGWAVSVNTDTGIITDPALAGTSYQREAWAWEGTTLQKMIRGHCPQKVRVPQ
jgi:hypothetical protein